ncbi:MAG: hypothetical protein ACR2OA_08525 [Rubripirellula sp.]
MDWHPLANMRRQVIKVQASLTIVAQRKDGSDGGRDVSMAVEQELGDT